MSADAPAVATVPYVDILREYHRVQALSTAERVAWKDSIIEEPEALAAIFERSITQLEDAIGKSLVNTSLNTAQTRNGPKPPPTPQKARNQRKATAKTGPKTDAEKAHDILYALFEAGALTVSGAPALAADYAGWRLAPLRTKDETVFDGPAGEVPAGDPSEHFSIDVLLQSRDGDALPVVGVLEYGDDIDALLSMLEALAYVALLAAPSQWARLRKQITIRDEDGESARFDERDVPQFDIYLVIAGHRRNAASKQSALWEAVPAIVDAVLDQPEIAKHVRRIEGIKLPLGADARVQLAGSAVLGKPVDWDND